MPITYDPIATTTVSGSSTNSVTFSSIPSTYTDLVLVFDGQFSAEGYLVYQLNGDTGTNYGEVLMKGNGATASMGWASSRAFSFSGAWANATSQFNCITNFQNYSNTTTNKILLSRGNSLTKDAVAGVSLWRNTSAITSIKAYELTSNSFVAGSMLTLYGIKAA
jgi:hypothetical protein